MPRRRFHRQVKVKTEDKLLRELGAEKRVPRPPLRATGKIRTPKPARKQRPLLGLV